MSIFNKIRVMSDTGWTKLKKSMPVEILSQMMSYPMKSKSTVKTETAKQLRNEVKLNREKGIKMIPHRQEQIKKILNK